MSLSAVTDSEEPSNLYTKISSFSTLGDAFNWNDILLQFFGR